MATRLLLGSFISIIPALAFHAAAEAQETRGDIEEIVVSGVRFSMSQSMDIKRSKMQIVDSIVAEDIGKFPDSNVVEALQRVSGIQVTDRGAGEVSTVSIRGLNDVTTTINGRNIFTASGRAVALADIPASLLYRVDTYKTRSSDMISSGIAGQIDIVTQRPFNFEGSKFVLATRGILQEQADKIDPNVSALLSNRWDTGWGELGALFNASFARTNFRDQTVTAGAAVPFRMPDAAAPLERLFPPLWEPGLDRGLPFAEGSTLADGTEYVLARDAVFQPDFTGERERPAWNLSLQLAPNESSQYTFEVFYNGYRQKSFNSLFFTFVDWWGNVDPADPVVFYEGTNIIKERFVNDAFGFNSGDYTDSKTDSYVYALGGLWNIGENLGLESEIVYQESFFKTEFFALQTNRVAPRLHVDFNSGGGIPVIEFFDNPATPVDESDLTEPGLWAMGPMFDNGQKFEGRAITYTADGNYEADWGIVRNIGFGLRYDERNAEEFSRTASAQPASCGGCAVADFPGIVHVTSGFFDGNADVPSAWAVAGADWLEANADVLRGAYGLPPASALSLTPNFEIDEDQTALYLQADFEKQAGGGVFDGQIGIQYLTVDTDMKFTDVGTLETSTASNSESKLLPSIMLRYGFAEDWLVRVSYGETLRLPTFNDLNATIFYVPDVTDIGYGTATGGNPELQPTESTNYDISLEWYFAEGSAVYGTWFKREIEGFVVPFRNPVQHDVPNDVPDIGLYTYILSQPDNASNGVLDGFEFGLVYFPENLPGWLNGAGVQATYTLLDSEQEIPVTNEVGEIVDFDILPIFGVSDTSYNVILAYDRFDFDMRLAYVWREDFLQRNEAALFANPLGIYRSPEESLDFQLSWAVNDNFTVTFDATNLTEEIYHEYYEFPDIYNFGNSLFSRTFALGVRFQM